jgi:hypothetical protein
VDAAETERFVGDLEIAVDRLRSLYEQYFMGIEKLEPTVPRKDVDRRIHVLRKEQIRNTAQRFRFQMILQKYNTYQTHWMRICREIENGTYKRHLLKARQRFGDDRPRASNPSPEPVTPPPVSAPRGGAPLAQPGVVAKGLAAELAELDEDFAPMLELDDDELEALDDAPAATAPRPAPRGGPTWRKTEPASPRAPSPAPAPAAPVRPAPAGPTRVAPSPAAARPAPAPAPVPRPAAAPPVASPVAPVRPASDLPEERVRQLYAQYVETKRQQRESTAAITFEAVAKSLRDSSAKLREKHGKNVDFEVSVKDGKTILKPVLK